MAVCNVKYEFTMMDIGNYGRRIFKRSVFSNSNIGIAMGNNMINLPAARHKLDKLFPYVFVEDYAFPLKSYMPKRYRRKSRASRMIENAFEMATT